MEICIQMTNGHDRVGSVNTVDQPSLFVEKQIEYSVRLMGMVIRGEEISELTL